MQFNNLLSTPGEHPLMLTGQVGQLEAVLTIPETCNPNYVAILGHPHSLQGGTMNNKVVTTMARAFKELAIPSLRFNFRGVGQSQGVYDDGIGESQDMLELAQAWLALRPQVRFIVAGFSFGSYVAYRTAAALQNSVLITIAPPVNHYDYTEFKPAPNPWLIVMGDLDEVVPADLVLAFASKSNPQLPVIEFAETGHFFHGKLIKLKAEIMQYVQSQVLAV